MISKNLFDQRLIRRVALLVTLLLLVLAPLSQAQQVPAILPDSRAISFSVHQRSGYQELDIHTALADYLFSTRGAVLESVYLYFAPWGGGKTAELLPSTETKRQGDQYVRTFIKNAPFPFALTLNGSPDLAVYDYKYTPQGRTATLSFTHEANGLRVTKRFVIHDDPYYTLSFTLSIKNTGSQEINWKQGYRLSLGPGVGRPKQTSQLHYLYDGTFSSAPLARSAYQEFQGAGFLGQDLALFLKLDRSDGPITPLLSQAPSGEQLLLFQSAPLQLASGSSQQLGAQFYGGRAKYTLLEHLGLQKLVGLGFFDQFIVPVVELLNWLYRATGNYAWAILLFTLIIRLLLFPLTRKQFHSMSKMAEVQPKVKKLQQQYPTLKRLRELHPRMTQEELVRRDRENRQKLQERMMTLYREEGVNPLGGCLPMLVQFPILIVLWRAIIYSAEQIHLSPGFLWIPDLALHDPYYILVGVTALAMIFQTKTTPMVSSGSPGQNPLLMGALSALFMVLFLKDFPAGLWLYYFLTTIIQIGQQVYITWELQRIKAARALARAAGGAGAGSEPSEPAEEKAPF